jgi:hypothetical protein
MWKKLLILSLSVTVLLFLAAPISIVDAGGKSKKMNWRVAGPIVDFNLVLLKAVGSPGRADLTIMGYDYGFVEDPNCVTKVTVGGINFVAVFNDLSMLFAKRMDGGEAYICQNSEGATFYFDMEINGGTGRFDGATGDFTAEGEAYGEPFFPGPLSAETGNFTGEIVFDD